MQITEMHAKNIMGIPRNQLGVPEVHLECGSIVEISGGNASGKSSLLEAMKAALTGGSLHRIKTVRTEGDPEVTLVFDDGKYRLERVGDTVKLLERVGKDRVGKDVYEKVKKPQSVIDAWFDKDLSNPVKFLGAQQKDRLNLFLEAVPLEVKTEQLREALGEELFPTVEKIVASGGHALQVLAAAHDALFEERRAINRTERQKRDGVTELRQDISTDSNETSSVQISVLESQRDEASARISKTRTDAEAAHRVAINKAETDLKAFEAKRRQTLEGEIAKLRGAADAEITAERGRTQAAREVADSARREALAPLAKEQETLDAIARRLAEARASIEKAAAERRTRELAEKYEREADELLGKSGRFTAGLEAITGLKARLLSTLPIPGLQITEADIYIDDVPFDQINESARLDLATEIIILRASRYPLKVAFIDGAEAFERRVREQLIAKLEAAGVQALIARVNDEGGPLEVA